MARRKRRGGERGPMKMVKKVGRIAAKAVGIVIILSPLIKAVKDYIGSPGDIPNAALYNYTGVQADGNINTSQTAAGVATVVGGVVLMKVLSWALR